MLVDSDERGADFAVNMFVFELGGAASGVDVRETGNAEARLVFAVGGCSGAKETHFVVSGYACAGLCGGSGAPLELEVCI